MKPFMPAQGIGPGGFDAWIPKRSLAENLRCSAYPEKVKDLYDGKMETMSGAKLEPTGKLS